MKRALRLITAASVVILCLVLLVGVLRVTVAFAAPTPKAVVSGTSPQTYGTALNDARLLAQCPAQVISFRPMNATDVHDAGVNDLRMDFVVNPDPFPIRMGSNQSRLDFRNIDGGSVLCNLSNE